MNGLRRSTLVCALLLSGAVPAAGRAQQPVQLDTIRASAGSRVVAGAASATRSMEVLDRSRIEALPARSVSELLARALGVDLQARSAAQADLSIRGSGFEQVLVMVDGVPVNDDQTGHFHLDLAVPLDAVERVEVLRGPAAALYGSAAVGGVVNIVTRRGGSGLTGRVQGGSFGAVAAAAEAALTRGGLGARFSAERDRSDGHRPGTDHVMTQARLALDAPLARGALRGDVGYAARDFGANGFYAPFDSYEETRTLTAALWWRSAPAALALEPRLSLRRHEDDFTLRRADPAFYRNVHAGRQAAAELVARWTPAAALRLALGAEAGRSALHSSSLGHRTEHRVAAFGELAAGDGAATLLTAGLRADRHSAFGSFLSPSLAAGHRVSGRVHLRAAAGGGFRAPSWTERYYRDPANTGNPDLGAEKFWTAETGLELSAGAASSIDVAIFIRRATDLIDWGRPAGSDDGTPWRTMNFESATFRGVEAAARTRLASADLATRVALLSFDAEAGYGLASKYALRPLTRSIGVEVAAPLVAAVHVTAHGTYYRRAPTAAGAATPAADDDWRTAGLRVSRNLAVMGGVQLFADASNVFDAAFADAAGQPAAGRAVAAGARIRR
jgi:vitamin B12 transporter